MSKCDSVETNIFLDQIKYQILFVPLELIESNIEYYSDYEKLFKYLNKFEY